MPLTLNIARADRLPLSCLETVQLSQIRGFIGIVRLEATGDILSAILSARPVRSAPQSA